MTTNTCTFLFKAVSAVSKLLVELSFPTQWIHLGRVCIFVSGCTSVLYVLSCCLVPSRFYEIACQDEFAIELDYEPYCFCRQPFLTCKDLSHVMF